MQILSVYTTGWPSTRLAWNSCLLLPSKCWDCRCYHHTWSWVSQLFRALQTYLHGQPGLNVTLPVSLALSPLVPRSEIRFWQSNRMGCEFLMMSHVGVFLHSLRIS